MDNEKKRPDGETGKKNRPPKHKGYFITPSDKGEKKQNEQRPAPAQQKPQREARPQEKAQPKQSAKAGTQAPQKPAQNDQSPQNAPAGNNASRPSKHKKRSRPHGERAAEGQNVQEKARAEKTAKTKETAPAAPATDTPHKKNHKKAHKSRPQSAEQRSSSLLLGSIEDAPAKKAYPAPVIETAESLDPKDIPADILETPASITMPKSIDTAGKTEVVGIRFKSSGKVYYFDPKGKKYSRASHAIVETARGLEYGEVAMGNTWVSPEDVVPPLRPVIRPATQADEAHHAENSKKEDEAFKICNEKISAHKLDMKLIDAQYTFDNSKLLFYFTSAGRVDFRDLVKDLASVFRTRIELRQIGIRDEARLMGGLGLCGRPLCCSLFLTDFGQVSIKMAKEQNLSLNSAKISGICGRLMCCLRYEHDTYEYEIKRTPPIDSLVQTPDGNGVVVEMSPLAGKVKVRLSVTPEVPPKYYSREDVKVLQKKAPKNNEEK